MKKEHLEFKSILVLICGIVAMIISFMSPNYFLNSFKPEIAEALISTNPIITSVVMFFVTLILVIISGLTVVFINKNQNNLVMKLVGLFVLVLVSAIPALTIMKVDSSFETIGIMYFISMIVAVIAWAGVALITNFYHKLKRSE
ncbi:MAG TPA: hypothetical protein PK816_01740 [Candidatus Cloacimonadota bacterium]|nr:hypothetical protein [Candidatus Cloacimonadota bacterium]